MSVINTNITSMIGQSNLNKSQNALQTSMERLSSGLRINSAKDDAAGQAIANRMTAQITGLAQAQRNANDGISVAQTAEGALNQVNDNLQRVRELSVQAQNGTNSADDLQSIQDEITQRLSEIDRISGETSFNGVKVLSSNEGLQIQVGANDGETITVNLEKINSTSLGLTNFSVNKVNLSDEITHNTADPSVAITTTGGTLHEVLNDDGTGTGDFVIKDADGNLFKAAEANTAGSAATAFNLSTSTTAVIATAPDGATPANDLQIRYSNDGNEVVQVTNSDGDDIFVLASAIGSVDTGDAKAVDALTEYTGEMTSGTPLADLDAALNQIDSLRSALGAVQNRFEDAITNLNTNETNLAAARSRIEDADYASEVANMTRAQILQQAGTSVLAQANQIPQNVLSLLG
ncbi:FliC/FljB family flagellin [Halomonas sp. A11-A]|uniref:FliC/FljB family flagellin n=1 Tax=Halomonas sp. A11-A TaxID=2183985 RepID=UPI000D70AE7B|nr:FliC/FljB family flagellin [Halomonas sp. A11-A]PWV78269.1 flagellin [Halomonas sp. A11-A]